MTTKFIVTIESQQPNHLWAEWFNGKVEEWIEIQLENQLAEKSDEIGKIITKITVEPQT